MCTVQWIQKSLDGMILRSRHFADLESCKMLINHITAVHVVYKMNSEYIHYFGELTCHYPGIMTVPQQNVEQDECMVSYMLTQQRCFITMVCRCYSCMQ